MVHKKLFTGSRGVHHCSIELGPFDRDPCDSATYSMDYVDNHHGSLDRVLDFRGIKLMAWIEAILTLGVIIFVSKKIVDWVWE